jgi:asparagine synthase (glutamine-hydrolysing)
MPISGIVVTGASPSVTGIDIERMLSRLAVTRESFGQHVVDSQAGFGVTSAVGAASLWDTAEVLVACEGEIYNQDELRADSAGLSEEVTPSHLVGQLYLRDSNRFLAELRGDFSVAIWDRRSRTLLLAVDRFSVKPLCYSVFPSGIAFASYPTAILASRRIDTRVNALSIVNYLHFTVIPAPLCAFEGIAKLMPGSFVVWKEGEIRTSSYWDMSYPEDAEGSESQLSRDLLKHMEDAVGVTSAGVPNSELGCFLSGGTDSSSVVGLLTRLKKEPVTAVSIGFSEDRFDELSYARIATRHFNSHHLVSVVRPQQALQIIPKIVEAYDEPCGNASVIPTFHCQAYARERGVKVMLAGDGGDELFGGNERYRTNQVYEIYKSIPAALRQGMIEPLVFRFPLTLAAIEKAKRYIRACNTPNPDRYFRWLLLQYFPPQDILAPGMPFHNGGGGDLLAVARAHYQAAPAQSELNRLLYLDVKMTLADNDLPKVVRTAEMAGLRVRFPFLEHSLAEFSGRIPANLKLKRFEKRYLFKKATRDLLPEAILNKKKHGFGLPIAVWLKTERDLRQMAEEILLDPKTYQRGYFQRKFVEHLFAEMDRDDTSFYGDLLWQFVMLELWHRHHVEGAAA